MELWQMDIVGAVMLVGGDELLTEAIRTTTTTTPVTRFKSRKSEPPRRPSVPRGPR
jgi:hypothetical protein